MKNSLRKIVLAVMMTVAPLVASEYTFQTHSLFAIEGGMSSINTEYIGGKYDDKEMGNLGLKIGAQSENYRVFLSARYYDVADLSTLNTYGAEFQYLFNFSEIANFYIGANGGVANANAKRQGLSSDAQSEMYYGGDAGFNIHATELIDLEIGARYMAIQDLITNNVSVDSITTVYASVIIKWEMD